MPCPFALIPNCFLNGVIKLHHLSGLILVGHPLHIIVDLFTTCIVLRPVWIVLKQERKARRWDVAGYTWVSVLKPDSADIYVFSLFYTP
jgi:hypothetical protein